MFFCTLGVVKSGLIVFYHNQNNVINIGLKEREIAKKYRRWVKLLFILLIYKKKRSISDAPDSVSLLSFPWIVIK
jgi:hypothetical protein